MLKWIKVPCSLALAILFFAACGVASPQPVMQKFITPISPVESPSVELLYTQTPEATTSPSPEAASADAAPMQTPKPTQDPFPYYIYVEKGSYTITIYGRDDQGAYTKAIKTFPTAIGRTLGLTPTGKFAVGRKERWHKFGGGQYAQYATSYYSRLYIHSSLFSGEEIDMVMPQYWYQFKTRTTSGCLRTTTYGAWWIYTYCPEGTVIEIVNGSPKGTSSAFPPEPIKAEKRWRYYDPTDPLRPGFTEPPS